MTKKLNGKGGCHHESIKMKTLSLLLFGCLHVLFVWSVHAADHTIKDPVIDAKGY